MSHMRKNKMLKNRTVTLLKKERGRDKERDRNEVL
jgi:hypothetical protein